MKGARQKRIKTYALVCFEGKFYEPGLLPRLRYEKMYLKKQKNYFRVLTKQKDCDIMFRRFGKCGCSSVVEFQPSKLAVWVRFPSPAP